MKTVSIKDFVNRLWFSSAEPFLGSLWQIQQHFQDSRKQPDLATALEYLELRWSEVQSTNQSSPIFIFAGGWRSGSTLLQRLIASSGEVMIWGEPYSHNDLIPSLFEPLKGFTEVYPRKSWFLSPEQYSQDYLTQSFTANLYPDVKYLLASHISFWENLFAIPSYEIGFSRWGIKDVRLGIDSAFYLRWLFPKAKFLFLYRNPYNAYTSFAGSYWYKRWPGKPIYSPRQFGSNWYKLTEGFIKYAARLEAKLLSYEDLCSNNCDLSELNNYLGIQVDPSILKIRVGGNIKQDHEKNYCSRKHLKVLQSKVEPLASKLGYQLD